MESSGSSQRGFYSYLINPNKSATRQLEDLCLGLVPIIVSALSIGNAHAHDLSCALTD
jgi:hypothetical protein